MFNEFERSVGALKFHVEFDRFVGLDFDPVDGKLYLRFCYAGSAEDMREAVRRIGQLARVLTAAPGASMQRET